MNSNLCNYVGVLLSIEAGLMALMLFSPLWEKQKVNPDSRRLDDKVSMGVEMGGCLLYMLCNLLGGIGAFCLSVGKDMKPIAVMALFVFHGGLYNESIPLTYVVGVHIASLALLCYGYFVAKYELVSAKLWEPA